MRHLKDLRSDKRGATAVEYGLILALIFLAMIVALRGLSSTTTVMWGQVSEKVKHD